MIASSQNEAESYSSRTKVNKRRKGHRGPSRTTSNQEKEKKKKMRFRWWPHPPHGERDREAQESRLTKEAIEIPHGLKNVARSFVHRTVHPIDLVIPSVLRLLGSKFK